MCLGALGSQTGGSITRPASFCGVPGCKSTYGRVSVHGVVPLAWSMDHVGPMARCVRDLALLLQVIAGADPYDPACSTRPVPDWTTSLSRPLRPPRLGRLRGLFESRADAEMLARMEETTERLQLRGAVIEDVALPAAFSDVIPRHRVVMAVEALQFHQQRLQQHPEDYPPRIRTLLEEGLATPAVEFARTKAHQEQLRRDMLPCFADVDALLTPATTGPAPDAGTTGDPAFNSPWSYLGYPTVCLPAGRSSDGLPLSIQLAAPPWAEGTLFAAAAWCEDALGIDLGEP
jgi:aspartyl-tRNA(Asn)/glutamyl-tRNA(Gln) amidotransferase subunit A